MNVDTRLDGPIHEVEGDAMNAITFYHNISFVAGTVILWLAIDVDVIDYNDI
jgi:hypothetical protein